MGVTTNWVDCGAGFAESGEACGLVTADQTLSALQAVGSLVIPTMSASSKTFNSGNKIMKAGYRVRQGKTLKLPKTKWQTAKAWASSKLRDKVFELRSYGSKFRTY